MKIVIIYGTKTKGSTYNCVRIVKNTLESQGDVSFDEFTLPTQLPHICLGCFSCFMKGEGSCPHAEYVQPIVSALREADGIILASPVYACDISSGLKTLFDHLCYIWMTHRPMEEMFTKVGMVISVTAGAGVYTSIRTMKKNLKYWGVKRTLGVGSAVAAMTWQEVGQDKKTALTEKLQGKAKKFYHMAVNRKKLKSKLFSRMIFKLMGKMIGSYQDGSKLDRDKQYWKDKGWFGGKSPFQSGKAGR